MLRIPYNSKTEPRPERSLTSIGLRYAPMGLPLDRHWESTGATPHSPGNASVTDTTARSERGLSANVD
jgi:hypothetical protein